MAGTAINSPAQPKTQGDARTMTGLNLTAARRLLLVAIAVIRSNSRPPWSIFHQSWEPSLPIARILNRFDGTCWDAIHFGLRTRPRFMFCIACQPPNQSCKSFYAYAMQSCKHIPPSNPFVLISLFAVWHNYFLFVARPALGSGILR